MKLETREEKVVTALCPRRHDPIQRPAVIPFWLADRGLLFVRNLRHPVWLQVFPPGAEPFGYEYLFARGDQIGMAYLITIIVTVIGTGVGLLAISLLAYGLVQKDIPGVRVVLHPEPHHNAL